MKLFRTLDSVAIGPSACAMGMFDGVHLGHRMVLEQAIRSAKIKGLSSVVFTFTNHPQSVISASPTPLLSTLEERIQAFESLGFDAVLLLDFTPALREMPAEEFIQTILLNTLCVKVVSIGYDHRFGKGRQGDGSYLKAQGDRFGFEVHIIEPIRVDHQIISSTLIRKLLSYGDLEQANRYLGHPYTLIGTVVKGEQRGRRIGFPTANLQVEPGLLTPAQGVYAGTARLAGENEERPAVCNIGTAPTFGDQSQPRVEVHLLDSKQNLYGQQLIFTFLHRLREERNFPSVTMLVAQLEQDCATAKALLGIANPRQLCV